MANDKDKPHDQATPGTDGLTIVLSPHPKRFDYQAFVEELVGLINVARDFPREAMSARSTMFSGWKHETQDLIDRISRKGYSINCSLNSRLFQLAGRAGSSTESEQLKRFKRDLDETLNELELIVRNYGRYGDPKGEQVEKPVAVPVQAPEMTVKELEKPETISIPWILENTSATGVWGFFVTAGTVVSVVFGAGYVGRQPSSARPACPLYWR